MKQAFFCEETVRGQFPHMLKTLAVDQDYFR